MITEASGMARTRGFEPVITSAVTEKPGRVVSGGWRIFTRTLKLMASEVVISP